MDNIDVSLILDNDTKRFNFRVGAIIVKDDRVLLQKIELDNFYTVVGGRVHFGEDTASAVIR